MAAEAVQSFFALAVGFAFAGMLTSGYQAATDRPASFRLLERGPRPLTFAAVAFLVFAAPFIIVRNVLSGTSIQEQRFPTVLTATVLAGLWSLMSGTVALSALTALGVFGA